jgi:CrcB protein
MLKSVIAISLGASAGSVLRWGLGLMLNALFPPIPMGTLAANLIGGYCIGLAVSFFDFFPALSPEWRLLCITGFLGGLTTFSTFSAEVTALLQQQRLVMAVGAIGLHVFGSLLMTLLGIATFALLKNPRI